MRKLIRVYAGPGGDPSSRSRSRVQLSRGRPHIYPTLCAGAQPQRGSAAAGGFTLRTCICETCGCVARAAQDKDAFISTKKERRSSKRREYSAWNSLEASEGEAVRVCGARTTYLRRQRDRLIMQLYKAQHPPPLLEPTTTTTTPRTAQQRTDHPDPPTSPTDHDPHRPSSLPARP